MFCPYALGQQLVQQVRYEYNEDGTVDMQELIENATPKFAECKGRECGAWRDGKCCYQNSG